MTFDEFRRTSEFLEIEAQMGTKLKEIEDFLKFLQYRYPLNEEEECYGFSGTGQVQIFTLQEE